MNRKWQEKKKESRMFDCPVRPVSYNSHKALWGCLNMGYTVMVQISGWVLIIRMAPLPLVLVED